LAHFELERLKPWETLNTTALVHEAYVKLVQQKNAAWNDRAHFLAASAKAMRHILVDAARRRLTQKQGAGKKPKTLDEALVAKASHATEVLAVDQALEHLRSLDERMCEVVECQFFAGFSKEETAEALGISVRTVHRDWLRAKGWLRKHLGPAKSGGDEGTDA
ncbi:MAG: sigma-70 family RNA polymerase sigma factor, partial [Acidobacteria bacterium]|nr:sigma-70 family RNA polymerase sigma factor [Acidobacteriota bacterium]